MSAPEDWDEWEGHTYDDGRQALVIYENNQAGLSVINADGQESVIWFDRPEDAQEVAEALMAAAEDAGFIPAATRRDPGW